MEEIRMNVLDVQEGMMTSKDVINEEGIFLIPKDTIINKNHILKLQLYQMNYVFVYERPVIDEAHKSIAPIEKTEKDIKITQSKEFQGFINKYISGVSSIEKEFSKVIDTASISSESLTGVIDSFITETTNSQLFSYLCRVQTADDSTFSHSMNVSILATILGKWLKWSEKDINNLSVAGLLHDIGKTKLDPAILNKKEPITDAEYEYLKTHTTLGYKMVAQATLDNGIKQAVLLHHEKMNGSGYPMKLNWDQVHKYAKVISIVDIYDALTSDRPYHQRYHPLKAIQILEEEYYGVLETDYLYVFLENVAHNFLGNQVLLSTGEEARIIFINSQSPSHPIVQTKSSKFIDLLSYDFIKIEKFL